MTTPKKTRILCLHGKGTSAYIFKSQCSSFEPVLNEIGGLSVEFTYVDGPIKSNTSPGVEIFYNPPYFSYWDQPTAVDAAKAREWLAEYISKNGPFDGVMGFSQGCQLAASVLLHHQKTSPSTPPPFKFAIFLCGAASLLDLIDGLNFIATDRAIEMDISSGQDLFNRAQTSAILRQGGTRWVDMRSTTDITEEEFCKEINGEYEIKVPTVHVYGCKDPRYFQGVHLAHICDKTKRKVYDHLGGHEIPRNKIVSSTIANLVKWAVEFDG